jgi:hypothetical protein
MKLFLIVVAVALTACSPKSQEEIAVGKMSSALESLKKGDRMMACLELTEAQGIFSMNVPNGKQKARELAPAVNKACNG